MLSRPRSDVRRRMLVRIVIASQCLWLGLLLCGCGASLPQLEGEQGSVTQPGSVSGSQLPMDRSADYIVGFRGQTVILYSSETSNDGERVPAATLPLPLRVRPGPPTAARVEIMTVQGPRWIAKTEVSLGPASAASIPR
jgi:hypothetical protein